MPKHVRKLEDFLTNSSFNQRGSDLDLTPPPKELTEREEFDFQDVLDFTFPHSSKGEVISQIGQVQYVGDAVAKISGIDDARIEEVINIKTPEGIVPALVLGIDKGLVETVVLGDYTKVKRGDQATSTATKLMVPTGPKLLGRVVDPLGRPLDGGGEIEFEQMRPLEFPGPTIMMREPIKDAMNTGLMVIDATIPVGRGQRELVIGDRKTGKTRTVLDAICNQVGRDVLCVYVGVGMQAAKAKEAVNLLKKRGALENTAVVMSFSDNPPTLQYLAPYAGSAMAEFFMHQGKHVLIVYDDLSKQAKAYRQVSLLLKRSPGRDAYPGDIFFLHSRLLERAAKLHTRLGGGSITALPVASTIGGDVSEYIITNLMSITDGHIFLDASMMNEGIMPAVNSGLSVSRIGGAVQVPILRKVGELCSRQLARYNEVKSFETINTEVSEETLRDIRRGKRVMEMFGQVTGVNLFTDEQILLLAMVTSGRIDQLEIEGMAEFKKQIITFYREHAPLTMKKTAVEGKKLEELDPMIDQFIITFQKAFPKYQQSITLLSPVMPQA